MASRCEIAQTLAAIGCTNNAVQYFLDEASRTYHLFPVSFEIMGMLSRTFHIQDSSFFTYILNPTSDRWDKRSFSLVKIMESYRVLSNKEPPHGNRKSAIYSKITQHITQILEYLGGVNDPNRLLFLKALHAAVNGCDEILTARGRGEAKSAGPLGPGQASVSSHELRLRQDRQTQRREIVQDVVRSHIQEVLRLLNEPDEQPSDTQSFLASDAISVSPRVSRYHARVTSPRFQDVDDGGPDEKQFILMQVYFEVIRMHVVHYATRTAQRRASFAAVPRNFAFQRHGSVVTHSSIAVQSDSGVDEPAITIHASGACADRLSNSSRQANGIAPGPDVSGSASNDDSQDDLHVVAPLANEPVSHDSIWCTLVFRMICWLMLHDFNEQDVQLSQSELLGSRMPVYIACHRLASYSVFV